MEKKASQYPIQPLRSKVKNVGFIVKCEECNKSRLFHGIKGAKRMISTVAYMCGSVLSGYMGTGNDKDEKFLQTIYVRENIMLEQKRIAILHGGYISKICIHCGVSRTCRTLGNSVEYYPKCLECKVKPDILRQKRKIVTEKDLGNKRK